VGEGTHPGNPGESRSMKIVTAADQRYFPFLLQQIVNCKKHLLSLPAVYDLGLDDDQKYFLGMAGIKTYRVPDHPKPARQYPMLYVPRATFKPFVILDFAYRTTEPIVWMDADAKPVSGFSFPYVELGIPRADPDVVQAYRETPLEKYVGPLHAAVVLLGESDKRMRFLEAWAADLENDELPSDMKSLNRVARTNNHGLHLTELDPMIWNSKFKLPRTLILHAERGPLG
jgi:hypothetical protein